MKSLSTIVLLSGFLLVFGGAAEGAVMTFSDLDPGPPLDQQQPLPLGYSTGLPAGITATWSPDPETWYWKNAIGPDDHTVNPDDHMAIFGQNTGSVAFSEPLVVNEMWMYKTTWGDTGDWTVTGKLGGSEQWSRTITDSSTWVGVQDGAGKLVDELSFSGGLWNHIDDIEFLEVAFTTLAWDENHLELSWNSPHWEPPPGSGPPDDSTHAVLAATNTDTVVVDSNGSAYSLTVDGGGIAIADAQTLTIARDANFAAGTTLSIGNGATLVAGGGSIDALSIAGNATISNDGTVPVASLSDGGVAGSFTKAGLGTLVLDNSSAAVSAGNTTVRVENGVLETRGPDPLGGAPAVELAGGALRVIGGGLMTFSDLDPGPPFDQQAAMPVDYSTGLPPGITAAWTNFFWKNANGPNDHTPGNNDRMQAFGSESSASVGFSAPLFVEELWMYKTTWGDTGDWTVAGLLGGVEQWSRTITTDSEWISVTDGAGVAIDELAFPAQSLWNHIDDVAFATAGWNGGIDLSGITFSVTDHSTLDLRSRVPATLGPLTMYSGVLTTLGADVSFRRLLPGDPADTTIDPGATAVGFNPQSGTDLGLIDGNGAAVTIAKLGDGDLILDEANVNLGQATFDVQQGRLIGVAAPNPFEGAALQLSGGELVLASSTEKLGEVTYDNDVAVEADSILTAGAASGVGMGGPLVVTLGGSPGNGVTVNNGVLTLQTTDQYSLNIAGPLGGSAGIQVDQGTITLAVDGSVGSAEVVGGTLNTANLEVVTMKVSGEGAVNTDADRVTISQSLKLDQVNYAIDAGNIFQADGGILSDAANLTLSGGQLTVSPEAETWTMTFSDLDPGPPTNQQAPLPADYSTGLPPGITATWNGFYWKNAASPDDHTQEPDDRMAIFLSDSTGSVTFSEPLVVPQLWMNRTSWGDTGNWTLVGRLDGADQWSHTISDETNVWVSVSEGAGVMIDELAFTEGSRWNHLDDFVFATSTGNLSINQPDVNLHVKADSTLVPESFGDAVFGNLTLDPGVSLEITGERTVNLANVTAGHDATIRATVTVRGNLAPGGSAGLLTIEGSLEFSEDAVYQGEIDQWDSTAVSDPWNPIPPSGTVNDKINVTSGDIFLGGTLELRALDKLHPPVEIPGAPGMFLEWFGEQTRIIATAEGESAVLFQFDAVPEALPEVPNIGMNWGQGHLGEGVFLTRQSNTIGDADPQDRLVDQPGVSYDVTATRVHLFQAADGDTNGDGTLDGLDLQAIQAAQTFGTGAAADWTTGDFTDGVNGDSAGVTDGEDLQAILATGLWGTPQPYAAVDPGDPGDGVVDLILDPASGGLSVETDGVTINGYVIKSRDGIFTGEPAQNLGAFQIDNDQEISGNFFFTLAGEHFFGNVIGPEWEIFTKAKGGGVDPFEDLTFTYTRVDMPGTFFGNLIVIPEPGTVVMLFSGAVALVLLALRRRRTG